MYKRNVSKKSKCLVYIWHALNHLKRRNGYLILFQADVGKYVILCPFKYSARQFKTWVKRVYLLDARSHFLTLTGDLVMNLIDPDHYTRMGRESDGLLNLIFTCCMTFHIRPSVIFDIGISFFNKFSVIIDYLLPLAQMSQAKEVGNNFRKSITLNYI